MPNNTPLPEPAYPAGTTGMLGENTWDSPQMYAYAAAVSAADNAALLKLNASQSVHIISQSDRIKVLEDAVQHYESALKLSWPYGASGYAFDHWNTARAALGDKS